MRDGGEIYKTLGIEGREKKEDENGGEVNSTSFNEKRGKKNNVTRD